MSLAWTSIIEYIELHPFPKMPNDTVMINWMKIGVLSEKNHQNWQRTKLDMQIIFFTAIEQDFSEL